MILTSSAGIEWPKDELFIWVMGGKQPMIAFDSTNHLFSTCANFAIAMRGKEHDLQLFHQISGTYTEPNGVGFHGWETWTGKSAEELDNLLPEIKDKLTTTMEIMQGKREL